MVRIKIPTGIEGLDQILDGGMSPGTFCIVTGTVLSGRVLLGQELFYRGLEANEASLYITTNNFTEDIIQILAEKGWFVTPYMDKYMFIDTFSAQADPSLRDTENIKYIHAVADFPKISNAIVSSMTQFCTKGLQQRLVFDSVDTLLMYISPVGVYRFLSYLRAKIKVFKAIGIFMLEPSLHDEKAMRAIMQLGDAHLELDEKNFEITASLLGKPLEKGVYQVTDKGIKLAKATVGLHPDSL